MPDGRPLLKLLRLRSFPILYQLRLEEALLRSTKDNWCLINDGAFNPAIVMGISGRPEELVHVVEVKEAGIQLIKRFTGGGTVVVDHDTIFITLIINGACLPSVEPFPRPVMQWTGGLYSSAFQGIAPPFSLRENDYVLGERKFGGNAQAFTGQRWLHHTSFLWDYEPAKMQLLQHPPKQPKYREGRAHEDFIVKLSDYVQDRGVMVDKMEGAVLALPKFQVQEATLAEAAVALKGNHIVGTKLIDLASC